MPPIGYLSATTAADTKSPSVTNERARIISRAARQFPASRLIDGLHIQEKIRRIHHDEDARVKRNGDGRKVGFARSRPLRRA